MYERTRESRQALCISDSPIDMRYRRVLEAAGCMLSPALDLRKGIKLAAGEAPRLVVLHTQFPDSEGLNLLIALARSPETAGIPVFVTSDLSEQRCAQLLDAGAIGFCHRDCLTREVVDAVLRRAARYQVCVP